MSNAARIGTAAGVAGAAMVIAFAAASSSNESKLDAPATCAATLSERGSFLVPDDTGRCDLLFPVGQRMPCELAPVADVTYEWSYRVTPLGIVTSGLQRGAVVAWECK